MLTKEEILNESIRSDAFALVQKLRERLYDIAMSELYVLLPEFEKKVERKIRRAVEMTDVEWDEPLGSK